MVGVFVAVLVGQTIEIVTEFVFIVPKGEPMSMEDVSVTWETAQELTITKKVTVPDWPAYTVPRSQTISPELLEQDAPEQER